MDVEADFLTGASSRDSLEDSRVQFTFPPSVDLGTSYGSYLHSRKSSTRKIHRKKPVNILQPLHRDLELLSASLNQLCSRLKSNGQTTGAIENALVGLQQLRSTVLATAPAGSRGEVVLYFLLQVVQALISVAPNLDGSSLHLAKDKEEAKALRRLYQTTEAELIATRRHCHKLKDRLDTVVEEADLKHSELSCELLATKKALAEARLELQQEKTKAQTAYLTSSQSQRELGKYKKTHLMQQKEKK
ncbi:PREDICTED: uncharacterized protein LOC109584607, partial [Amphimedon queenslandica]|uniref:Uncharacterized protein n=2 Tax=Amphimedon queenslandica TaxID=400682 RepID=A0AAN0JG86_AMPQE